MRSTSSTWAPEGAASPPGRARGEGRAPADLRPLSTAAPAASDAEPAVGPPGAAPSEVPTGEQPGVQPGARLVAFDQLRAALVGLVICHHAAVAFGAEGGWYYKVGPPPGDELSPLLLTMFAALNQSFFMALLFGLAGFFTVPSFDGKGSRGFLRDRGLRLGLPLAVYFFVLNPCVEYLADRFSGATSAGFVVWSGRYWLEECAAGPLWFVLSLLVYSAAYAGWLSLHTRPLRPHSFPSHGQIALFVLVSGLAAFCLRLVFPVGETLGFTDVQPGHHVLYVSLFVLGIVARRSGWLEQLGPEHVRPWLAAVGIALLAMPVVMLAGARGDEDEGLAVFLGGLHWQAWLYATWESLLCVGISLGLIRLFATRVTRPTPRRERLRRSAYTAYIIHPFFVVTGTWLLSRLGLHPLLAFALLCLLAVTTTYAVSDLVRRLPGVRRVV